MLGVYCISWRYLVLLDIYSNNKYLIAWVIRIVPEPIPLNKLLLKKEILFPMVLHWYVLLNTLM